MASKIKKALKKIGKAAAVAGAGYLAMKGLKNRKQKNADVEMGLPKADMRDYGPFSKSANYVPGPSKFVQSKTVLGKKGINRMDDGNFYQGAKDGGRIGKKFGGSVKKSMGKALRGGGKEIR